MRMSTAQVLLTSDITFKVILKLDNQMWIMPQAGKYSHPNNTAKITESKIVTKSKSFFLKTGSTSCIISKWGKFVVFQVF
jgi:hypothetical protein